MKLLCHPSPRGVHVEKRTLTFATQRRRARFASGLEEGRLPLLMHAKSKTWLKRAMVLGMFVCGCAKDIQDRGASRDFRNPKWVVSSLFHAAQTGDAAHLATLCDPSGEVNEHARRVCALRRDEGEWDSFVEHFAKGALIGEARISGNRALVNFAFGPEGTRPETMELVRRGHRWYLKAF